MSTYWQSMSRPGRWGGLAWIVLWLACATPLWAEDYLTVHTDKNRVDAQIEGWALDRLLEQISEVTGWQVYVEPETRRSISVKFKNLTWAEALQLMLGNINYALLPQLNGPSKLFVFHSSVQEATHLVTPVKPAKAPLRTSQPIPNELIVTLKPGAHESIEDLARRLGAKVVGRADDLRTYRLQFDSAEATTSARDQLATNSEVEAAGPNYAMIRPTRTDALAMSSPIPLTLRFNPNGDSMIVGLIDTAVQAKGSGIDKFLLPSVAVAGDATTPTDSPTHGTSMAETILQAVAKATGENGSTHVQILPVDVYGANASTTTFDVASGIARAVNSGTRIVNLSLGGDGDSPFLHQVIKDAAQQGVIFVAAAGNDPTTTPTYPAAYPEVLAITAGNKNGLASYANRGGFVDAVAPGSSIVSFQNNNYLVTGTSTSTANFTGLLAGRADATGKSLNEVKQSLLQALSPTTLTKP
jgi:hypothetical protein